MKHQTKLSGEQQQTQQAGTEQKTQAAAAREFAGAEEMLRYDAAHTTVPPEIAERLKKSTADSAGSRPSWWRKFFGGNL